MSAERGAIHGDLRPATVLLDPATGELALARARVPAAHRHRVAGAPGRRPRPAQYDRIWEQLGSRAIEDLVDLPPMTDPELSVAPPAASRSLTGLATIAARDGCGSTPVGVHWRCTRSMDR